MKYWLPVLLWMLFIFIGSTDLMSAEHTSRFIGPFLRWFAPDITTETIAQMQFLLRKVAHLIEYAILAWLLWRAIRQNPSASRGFWRGAALAFGVSVLCATLDEFHQAHIASRTGSPWDVLIDAGGAGLALLIVRICQSRSRRKSST